MKTTIKKILVSLLCISLFTGCSPAFNENLGRIGGTTAGAGVGAVIGKEVGGDQGTVIGAIIGAGIGYFIGDYIDQRRAKQKKISEQYCKFSKEIKLYINTGKVPLVGDLSVVFYKSNYFTKFYKA